MRISLLDANGVVTNVILGELENFPNGIEDKGHSQGDKVDRETGDILVPAPVITPPTHATKFYADDLLAVLTADEFDAIDALNNTNVQKFLRRLSVRKKVVIDTEDPIYQTMLGRLLSLNILTQDRHDELLKGIPL